MAISTQLIQKLRNKEAKGPFVFLIDFYNKENNVIRRLTNYEREITYLNNPYMEFPFVYSIPEFNDNLGQSIQLTFGNFKVGNYSGIQEDLDNTDRIEVYFMNVEDLSSPLFPKAVYFFTAGDSNRQDDTSIRMTFSRRILNDKKFPFRRYNSDQHPTLYEEYADAPLK